MSHSSSFLVLILQTVGTSFNEMQIQRFLFNVYKRFFKISATFFYVFQRFRFLFERFYIYELRCILGAKPAPPPTPLCDGPTSSGGLTVAHVVHLRHGP